MRLWGKLKYKEVTSRLWAVPKHDKNRGLALQL